MYGYGREKRKRNDTTVTLWHKVNFWVYVAPQLFWIETEQHTCMLDAVRQSCDKHITDGTSFTAYDCPSQHHHHSHSTCQEQRDTHTNTQCVFNIPICFPNRINMYAWLLSSGVHAKWFVHSDFLIKKTEKKNNSKINCNAKRKNEMKLNWIESTAATMLFFRLLFVCVWRLIRP